VVVEGDKIAIRALVNLCLTFDHRVLDGALAGRFLQSVRRRLEAMGPQTALD
jgi:2-oxoisovalerate dehydrogenase E2 component (dihydrolipoyl transacylase)